MTLNPKPHGLLLSKFRKKKNNIILNLLPKEKIKNHFKIFGEIQS